jgi:hypothetical protein
MRSPYAGYYDEWEYVRSVAPEYSTVQIDDVVLAADSDALLGHETVITYDEYLHPPAYSYSGSSTYSQPALGYTPSLFSRDNSCWRPRFVEPVKDSIFNPLDEQVVCTNNPFQLGFSAKVWPTDNESWVYFASEGLDVYSLGRRMREASEEHDKRFMWERYRLNLRHGTDLGFIQLFQSAKFGAENGKGIFPYGCVMTIYVTRGRLSQVEGMTYPPMMPITPIHRQTFVVLRPAQLLQLRLPNTYTVDTVPNMAAGAVRPVMHHKSAVGSYDCHYYKVVRETVDSFPIFFSARETARQGVVMIPPIETVNGSRYAVIHSPLSELAIYPEHIDGLIFRRMEGAFNCTKPYLDQQCKLRVESAYRMQAVAPGTKDRHEVHDLRVQIMDKTLRQLHISHLFDDAQVTAEAS